MSEIAIRRLEIADAAALIRCFERCYGATYPADAFHDASQVESRVAAGSLRSVVAVDADGELIGHMGLTSRAPGALSAEAGNTVVDPHFRGQHLAARLGVELSKLCLASGWTGFLHYPTTAHPVMQRLAVAGGGIETGVLLDYIPAQTEYLGFEAAPDAGRIAVVAVYQPLGPVPSRTVLAPARHRELLTELYSRAGLDRSCSVGGNRLPHAETRLESGFEPRRGLLKIDVVVPCADLGARVADAGRKHPDAPAIVDLRMDSSVIDAACEQLRTQGFGFGALLPEYAPATDVLRLQRPVSSAGAPELETGEARELMRYAAADRAV
jgi:hypothetical protein